jgi:hypothetical protein
MHRLTSRPALHAVDVQALDGAEPGVDVSVMLGETLIYAGYVAPARDFVIGEGKGASFEIGEDVLGLASFPFVLARGSDTACSIPNGASIELRRGKSVEPTPESRARPSEQMRDAREIDLEPGETLRVQHRAFTFVARARTPRTRRQAGWKTELAPLVTPLAYLGTLVILAAVVLLSLSLGN